MQRVSVIDLGSSSVRLMQVQNGVVLSKRGIVTRLAENKKDGYLQKDNMLVTTKVVIDFVEEAKAFGGDIYIFATASLRNSKNGQEYAEFLSNVTGVKVDIVAGEQEAEIGLLGALGGKEVRYELDKDGNAVRKLYLKLRFVVDERATDGLIYAEAFRKIKKLIAKPEVLMEVSNKMKHDVIDRPAKKKKEES